MFNKINKLFSQKEKKIDYYHVDIHSHLIPAIDDGSKSMQESIEIIKKFKELGFKKLITTPHIMQHRFPNTSQIILSGVTEVQNELVKQGIDIELEAASEYYLDEHFMKLLEKRDVLTFGDNYLLFELSYAMKPANLLELIYEIEVAGYQPVLAHPERYLYLHDNFALYEQLKERGVLFQVNLNSFSGYYSKPVQKAVIKISEKGWINFIGSDTHKLSQLEHFSNNYKGKVIEKIFENNSIRNNQLL